MPLPQRHITIKIFNVRYVTNVTLATYRALNIFIVLVMCSNLKL